MFRLLILAIPLVFLAAPAAAAGGWDKVDCKNPQDQSSMNYCADQDYRAADKKLNAVYQKVMAALDDDGYKTKLKAAERAWMTFRDTECTFETAENEGGSIHPLVYSGCETRLTDERTKALQSYLACFKDADTCK